MYYVYDKHLGFEIAKQKVHLQKLYKEYYTMVEALRPYETYLESVGTSLEDLKDGKFIKLNPYEYSNESKVVRILYNNCINSFKMIDYLQLKYDKTVDNQISETVFRKVLKSFFKHLIRAMIKEKYFWGDTKIGWFGVFHYFNTNAINWEKSEANKAKLKEEGKLTEDTHWIIKEPMIMLTGGWVKDYKLQHQRHLADYEFSPAKGQSGFVKMLSTQRRLISAGTALDFPSLKSITHLVKDIKNEINKF